MSVDITLKQHLEMKELHNVILLPKDIDGYPMGVYDEAGEYVAKSGKRFYSTDQFSTTQKNIQDSNILSEIECNIDEPIIYAGYIRIHWGHFRVDGMARLWWTNIESGNKTDKIVVYQTYCDILPEIYVEILTKMGIMPERLIYIDQPVRCKTLYYPELSYVPYNYILKEYYNTFRKVMESVDKLEGITKLYVSKQHFSKRHHSEFVEGIVEHIFKNNGYKVIYPEELSLRE